jgi:hypothetical protein
MRVSACAQRGSADVPRRARDARGVPRLAQVAALGALAALGLLGRVARAQSPDAIRVERQPGAEDCPDTDALAKRVAALLGRSSDPQTPPYLVTFARTPQAFSAAIRAGDESATVRRLSARESSCAALAHATAVALAVLLDADLSTKSGELSESGAAGSAETSEAATEKKAEPIPPKPAPSPASSAPEAEPPEPPSTSLPVYPFAAVGAGAALGVLRPASFALRADVGLELRRLRASVGALWLTPQTLHVAPGSAREQLLSASFRACYALADGARLRLDACSGAFVGAAQAEARGFSQNLKQSELFLAFPAGLALATQMGQVGWELAASALLVCPPNEFNVVGRGPTYQPSPVAGLFTLSVSLERRR